MVKKAKIDPYAREKQEAAELQQSSGLPYDACWNLVSPDNEETTVAIIKAYLRTPAQKAWLDSQDISIEDMLNGRVAGADNMFMVEEIFHLWNRKLGKPLFGQEYFDYLKKKGA